ncbi:hypothetical protein KL930_002384 [Ogataea haglerorum]|uniref:PIH1 N-terminal domain-containing protein n=1 Tax=Ogataea haglerorum TaxID=1937702 RepID=A0AAN6D8Z1_9ASCO|nr:uncharacterized protein KL911_000010 [Ogataea haglerorum]KAG7698829.1 hypothetical protein KL915_001121 [Ogataea haglerorum]KAG7709871.1 hypothetical protein KL914_000781 [Ogataea haglerorum]KAG7711349.1 hypothetical protein KL950_001315 [Ogataea haglerorum]KAG7720646.1 hypothetical protein KL913_001546 [Ogataea haglerorum]KAG7721032.1 hypothetical protein KL949_001904 [Ogataea haglerorum]
MNKVVHDIPLSDPDSNSLSDHLVSIIPHPKFVVKTRLLKPFRNSPARTKLFVNVCSNANVPLPLNLSDPIDWKSLFLSIANDEWQIPILLSPDLRDGKDKSGNSALIIDCILNERAFKMILSNISFRDIVIEWCFDAIESRFDDNILIDRQIKTLPKRSCMGELLTFQTKISTLRGLIKATASPYEHNQLTYSNASQIESRDDNSTLKPLPTAIAKSCDFKSIGSKERTVIHQNLKGCAYSLTNSLKCAPQLRMLDPEETEDSFIAHIECPVPKVCDNEFKLMYNKKSNCLIVTTSSPINDNPPIKIPLAGLIPSLIEAICAKNENEVDILHVFLK